MKWIAYGIWQVAWRAVVTVLCLVTLQNIINQHGYRVDFNSMLIAAVCSIIGIRVWMTPFTKDPVK